MICKRLAEGIFSFDCSTPLIDLAGDGGGDQSGSALLQEVDGALGFGGESVEFA